jgi:hypothetical protein
MVKDSKWITIIFLICIFILLSTPLFSHYTNITRHQHSTREGCEAQVSGPCEALYERAR